jgi:hypothetical protein
MRSAFQDTLADADFRADADTLQLSLNPAPAEALANRTSQTLDASPAVIEIARRYYPR